MSHFTVLVIGENVQNQLQPYHEYECTGIEDEYVKFVPAEENLEELQEHYEENKEKYDYTSFEEYMKDYHGYSKENGQWGRRTNPNAKWDWWSVGGRWTGFFKLKEGATGEVGELGLFSRPPKVGFADIVSKGDVDWDYMRNVAGEAAEKKWDLANESFKDILPFESWETIRLKNENNLDVARYQYNNQPAVIAFNEMVKCNTDLFGWYGEAEEFLVPKDVYVERIKNAAITTYAIVKDDVWYQKGKMGWWGMSSNEMSQDEWNEKFWELIQSVPDDTKLTLVDCHI